MADLNVTHWLAQSATEYRELIGQYVAIKILFQVFALTVTVPATILAFVFMATPPEEGRLKENLETLFVFGILAFISVWIPDFVQMVFNQTLILEFVPRFFFLVYVAISLFFVGLYSIIWWLLCASRKK